LRDFRPAPSRGPYPEPNSRTNNAHREVTDPGFQEVIS
jgi:hypothetical protein